MGIPEKVREIMVRFEVDEKRSAGAPANPQKASAKKTLIAASFFATPSSALGGLKKGVSK